MFDVLEPEDPPQVGRYRIVARVGAGGMGQVYLGRSPGGRPVAVKVVRPELARDGDFRRRFAREVAAARRVNGAFTAGVVDADPDGSPAWLATVYVSGVSLGEAIAQFGPWPAGPVLALGAGLAEALEAIHAAGVVHRDLKPSNVLLASDGPRVIDFGISTASEISALTHTGMTIGTPGFMSPEQLTGAPVGPASDVFALGAVLAYTAAGVGPFGTGTPHALHFRAVYEQPDLDGLSPGLREIVAACLAKQPDQRPTVADLLHRMTTPGDGETADATLLLAEPGWMPDAVNRLVQQKTATALPRTPSPTVPDVPAAPPETTPDSSDPSDPSDPSHTPPGSPETPLPRNAPAATDPSPPGGSVHEAPTQTADHAARGAVGPSEPAGEPADPAPSAYQHPVAAAPLTSRRRALLALTGTALAAGTAVAAWKLPHGGSGSAGSPSAGQSNASKTRPVRTPPPPVRKPGQQRWAFPIGGDPAGGSVVSSPTVANSVVYVGSNDTNLYAVNAATGKKRWAFPTGNVVQSSPAVANGVVYVGSGDDHLYAVDTATGKKRWAFRADGLSSSPAVVEATVYVGSADDNLYAVDVTTGRKRWAFRTGNIVDSSPAVVDGVVYIGSEDHDLYAVDAATGRKRWAFRTGDIVDSPPAVADGLVYVSSFDSRLYAVDAATGTRRWSLTGAKHAVPGAGNRAFSSPTVVDGVVYVGDEIENLYALDAATGKQRWAFRTGGSVFSIPTVANGVVYVGGDDGHLYAVDAATGKQRWAFRTGGGANTSPTVVDGVVYICSDGNMLYAVQT